jgi:diadenosine tetraphosphate (Ap4A) HIT family hydrolase
VHAYDSELLGWLVLACRQHRDSIADLNEAEAAELGGLVRAVSIALGDTLHYEKTYVAQFAEHPLHRHVHVHVVARTDAVSVTRCSSCERNTGCRRSKPTALAGEALKSLNSPASSR